MTPLTAFVLVESAVLLYRPSVWWTAPVVLAFSLLWGFHTFVHVAAALFFAYTYLYGVWSSALPRHHYRQSVTYRDWLLWWVVLVVLLFVYLFSDILVPNGTFPLGRISSFFVFLAIVGVLYYSGRTEYTVHRLWRGINDYDYFHLYWVVTVSFFTLVPTASFKYNFALVAFTILSLIFIILILYRIVH